MNMTDRQCLGINNRFKLVVLASQRAHDLSSGAHSTIDDKKSKNTVVALKEILSSKLNNKALFDFAVKRCRSYIDELFSVNNSGSSMNNSSSYDTDDNFLNANEDSDSNYCESNDLSSDDELLVDPSFDELDLSSSDDNDG